MDPFREIDLKANRIYVFGDLHGCLLELTALLDHIRSKEKLSKEDLVVFIGDYVDRGRYVREVLELLIAFKQEFPNTVFLKGNHEQMLLSYIGVLPGDDGCFYIENGGAATVLSYGLEMQLGKPELPEALGKAIPEAHQQFLLALDNYVITPEYVFVHAGLNPLRDLKAQAEWDLFWIRDEFVQNLHYFKRLVVFGHTPFENVLFHLPYKLGIDTGAVYGNKLSCVELKEGRVLQVATGTKEIEVKSFPKNPGWAA